MLSFPPFRLDLRTERLWKQSDEVRLRAKPFAILKYLVAHPQRLISHAELVQAVWGKMAISDSLLRTYVRDLRQVLGQEVIETVVGRGYRFLPQLTDTEAPVKSTPERSDAAPTMAREAELTVLHVALRGARQGRRMLAFVTGAPGAGKTTLADAFVVEVQSQGFVWVARGTCVEQYGPGEAYLPFFEALGVMCRGSRGQEVIDMLARHAPTWLAEMPGLAPNHQTTQTEHRGRDVTPARMVRELAEALEALSAAAPVIVVLDDLQWSDPSTADLLAVLARRRLPARILVIGTHRPCGLSRAHPLGRVFGELVAHGEAVHVGLEGFDEHALRGYMARRYPDHAFPWPLARTVHRSTGGNPMLISLLFDDLEGRCVIHKVDGVWTLTASVDEVGSRHPESARRLIDTHLERLDGAEQRLLEAASVAGFTFTAGLLAHALGSPVDEVDALCESLANDRHLLQHLGTEAWADGTVQARYAFVHALVQYSAHARSSSAAVRAWHRLIAERLERGYGGRVEEIASELAVHYDRGQVFPKAITLYLLASERALRRHGHLEPIQHVERARRLLPTIPEGQNRDELELRTLLCQSRSLWRAEQLSDEELMPVFERAVALATRLGDEASLCDALYDRRRWLAQRDLRAADQRTTELLTAAERVTDPGRQAGALYAVAVTKFLRGQFAEARSCVARVVTLGSCDRRRGPLAEFYARTLATAAMLEWLTGHPDEAVHVGRAALTSAAVLGSPWVLCEALCGLAVVHGFRRESELATQLALRALSVAGEWHLPTWQARASSIAQLGSAPCDAAAQADVGAREAWGVVRAGSTLHALACVARSLHEGQRKRALEGVRDALALVEETDERFVEPELHRLRGHLLRDADASEAERCYGKAIEVARLHGGLAFELRATLSLYRHVTGEQRERARHELRRIVAAFSEGQDTPDVAEARAALAP